MESLNYKIVETFESNVLNTYDDALQFATSELNWDESEILDGREDVTVKLENGEIATLHLPCLYIDSGSVDYIFYLRY